MNLCKYEFLVFFIYRVQPTIYYKFSLIKVVTLLINALELLLFVNHRCLCVAVNLISLGFQLLRYKADIEVADAQHIGIQSCDVLQN